jgi:hypothetical protein
MAYVEVFNLMIKETKTECPKRDLQWYDIKKHEMLKFNCSKLEFIRMYDDELKEYRILPKAVNEEVKKVSNIQDKLSVDKWFNRYSNYNDTAAYSISNSVDSTTFHVDEEDLEDFLYDLERNNFRFSVTS